MSQIPAALHPVNAVSMLGQVFDQTSGFWHLGFKICSGQRVAALARGCDGCFDLVKRRLRHGAIGAPLRNQQERDALIASAIGP
jgi:hypothetical protein